MKNSFCGNSSGSEILQEVEGDIRCRQFSDGFRKKYKLRAGRSVFGKFVGKISRTSRSNAAVRKRRLKADDRTVIVWPFAFLQICVGKMRRFSPVFRRRREYCRETSFSSCAAEAAGTYGCVLKFKKGKFFIKRILVMVLHNLFLVPAYWIKLCYHAKHAEKYTDEQHYEMIQTIVHHANSGGRVQVDSYGVEKLPKEQGFMLYPNHQGLYDTLAIADAFPYPFSVVAKKEVQNVPFIKQMLACMQGYCIDREDIRQSMEVINHVAEDVRKKKKNFIIFAEGTRSRQGNVVQSFKGGSFKCATKAKCPIVPVALINSFLPFDSSSTNKVTVQVHYLEPITYEEYKDRKTTEIAEMVEQKIRETVKKYA